MKTKSYWALGLIGLVLIIAVPSVIFLPKADAKLDDPWSGIPKHPIHTDHSNIIKGPFETGQDVTNACLECHPEAAKDFMMTTHWTWESKPFDVPWRDEPVTIGKANQINNFCISAQGNQRSCTACHTGYGWTEEAYDFSVQENVDCLVCHADVGTYSKGKYGNPADGIDLLAAAQSVQAPTRENCGRCHFNGGGGNGVKHGDLDASLTYPDDQLDIHMGEYDFICTDCHTTTDHTVKGRLVADNYTIDPEEQVACTDCHAENPHTDERIGLHMDSIACQTCHVPAFALEDPTKMTWDWSTSGQDFTEDHYTYLKIKGSFEYDREVTPVYTWFNGNLSYRYIIGDPISQDGVTFINKPAGDINDSQSKIFPFKVHVTNQPYDTGYNYLLTPITAGPDGYWTTFDWDSGFKLAEERMGLPYSGGFDFTETWMYWPSTHMVQPKENALQCDDCHGEDGRMDWEALGYPGDPIEWGSRSIDE